MNGFQGFNKRVSINGCMNGSQTNIVRVLLYPLVFNENPSQNRSGSCLNPSGMRCASTLYFTIGRNLGQSKTPNVFFLDLFMFRGSLASHLNKCAFEKRTQQYFGPICVMFMDVRLFLICKLLRVLK